MLSQLFNETSTPATLFYIISHRHKPQESKHLFKLQLVQLNVCMDISIAPKIVGFIQYLRNVKIVKTLIKIHVQKNNLDAIPNKKNMFGISIHKLSQKVLVNTFSQILPECFIQAPFQKSNMHVYHYHQYL